MRVERERENEKRKGKGEEEKKRKEKKKEGGFRAVCARWCRRMGSLFVFS